MEWRSRASHRLFVYIAILVLLLWFSHRIRRIELARYEGETTTATVTYIAHGSPLGLTGMGGIWCEVQTEQGTLGRWLTGRLECDMSSDWSAEVRPTPSGIEIEKWKYDDRELAETFRFQRITGPHVPQPDARVDG